MSPTLIFSPPEANKAPDLDIEATESAETAEAAAEAATEATATPIEATEADLRKSRRLMPAEAKFFVPSMTFFSISISFPPILR
jgi:hypothetical protein